MNVDQVLALYDRQERRDIEFPGMVRVEAGRLVLHAMTETGEKGMVIYSVLDAGTVDEAVDAAMAFFAAHGGEFEWKVYSHDRPPDLRDRLVARGFEAEEEEAIVALDLAAAPPKLLAPITHDVRLVVDEAGVAVIGRIQEEVWEEDFSLLTRRLAADLRRSPEMLRIYLAFVDEVPAAAAWVYFVPGSQFASFWGGATLPAFRGRGLYTALLAARVQEARHLGARYATVDAGAMSLPILRRLGFQLLTVATPCIWRFS